MSSACDLADRLAEDIDALASRVRTLAIDLDQQIEGARRGDPLLRLIRGRVQELFDTTDELATDAEELAERLEEETEEEWKEEDDAKSELIKIDG
jgi:hypothetical protein